MKGLCFSIALAASQTGSATVAIAHPTPTVPACMVSTGAMRLVDGRLWWNLPARPARLRALAFCYRLDRVAIIAKEVKS